METLIERKGIDNRISARGKKKRRRRKMENRRKYFKTIFPVFSLNETGFGEILDPMAFVR